MEKSNRSDSAASTVFTENKEMSNESTNEACFLDYCPHKPGSKPKRLTVVVDDGSHQLVFLQHGEKLQGFGLTEDVAALQTVDPGHQVVHLDPGPVVRQLPPPGE